MLDICDIDDLRPQGYNSLIQSNKAKCDERDKYHAPFGHSERGTVGARYTEAMRITLGSSDLNGFGPVGKTRGAALMHRGLLEPRKGVGFIPAN